MGEATSVLADFKRYAELIQAELRSAFPPLPPGEGRGEGASEVEAVSNSGNPLTLTLSQRERGQELNVEHGIVYPRVVLDPKTADLSPAERVIELAGSERLASIAIVDGAEPHAPVQPGPLVHSP